MDASTEKSDWDVGGLVMPVIGVGPGVGFLVGLREGGSPPLGMRDGRNDGIDDVVGSAVVTIVGGAVGGGLVGRAVATMDPEKKKKRKSNENHGFRYMDRPNRPRNLPSLLLLFLELLELSEFLELFFEVKDDFLVSILTDGR